MAAIASYYLTLTGTPYENGQAKARLVLGDASLHANLTDWLRWFDEYDRAAIDWPALERCRQLAAERLPALLDEIRGFGEALGISYERYLPYLLFDWEIHSACSQFCVLPAITRDGHVYSGHSWEWTMEADRQGRLQTLEEDNLYVIARSGDAAYMGFVLNYFGLWNGMNAYGVSINPTGGVHLKESPPATTLYNHGLTVRIVLETCRSADEALAVLRDMVPLTSGAGGGTYIIADRSGRAYYVERANDALDIVQVGVDTDRPYQCAANHFVNPRMLPSMSKKGVHSILRYSALNRWIEAHRGQISLDTLCEMQQQPFPDGPCCHYYSDYLGTVRSMVYDLSALQAMVCFGSPRLNPWRTYNLAIETTESQVIETVYENEEADPAIWVHIPPEAEYS